MWTGPDRPELEEGLAIWYDDFAELSTDRQLGMIAGPIPHSSIIAHTQGWLDHDAEMFRVCIRRMDDVYLNFDPKKVPKPWMNEDVSPQDRLTAIFGKRID